MGDRWVKDSFVNFCRIYSSIIGFFHIPKRIDGFTGSRKGNGCGIRLRRMMKGEEMLPVMDGNGPNNHIKRDIQMKSQDMDHGQRENGKVGCREMEVKLGMVEVKLGGVE